MKTIFLHAFGIAITLTMAVLIAFTQDLTNITNQLSLGFVLLIMSFVIFRAIKENKR
jgi:hypothetical protein